MGEKDKIDRSFFAKDNMNLAPKWGGRTLVDPVIKKQKTSSENGSNPGLASFALRKRLVERLRHRGISDETVLSAIENIERHTFVDSALASLAYEDIALPLGFGQTISQPFVVARTISIVRKLLSKCKTDADFTKLRVLEVGCGSGYQASVLSECFGHVTSVERIFQLYENAVRNCDAQLRSGRLKVYFVDGSSGFESEGPYDAIFFSAALKKFPVSLINQLTSGGVVIAPTGEQVQHLLAGTKNFPHSKILSVTKFDAVSYVPVKEGLERL